MCGIVGAFAFKGRSFRVERAWLEELRDEMAHRGPDGAGTWIEPAGRIGLGHRRLSIIDLSDNASQPMTNEDGQIVISFNGEIYNHAEIRAELERIGGHQFKTNHSDTEVILHAYEEWGTEAVHRLRGMFAFALWDGRRRQLWLVRDRLGIKPLYFSQNQDRLLFASEIKALLRDRALPRQINEEAFFHYLSFLTVPAPQTLFANIYKLPAATWIMVDEEGQVKEHRYWDALGNATPMAESDEKAIADRILQELETSVALHGVSDVPVGVFLSGGIDSSTNAALFSKHTSSSVQTFSIGYDGEYASYQNELSFARQMANAVGATQHERLLRQEDLIDFLPKMVWLQDEPIADPVCVPVYYVSKLARDNGVIVCQVGEGSDELFWGYPWWKRALRLTELAALPGQRLASRGLIHLLDRVGKQYSSPREWLRRGTNGLPIFWGGAEAFTDEEKRSLLSPRLRQRFAGLTSWDALAPIHQRYQANAWESHPLSWMSYLDLNLRLPELLLMRVDKMSMGVSLETRVPFLDHKFVELAMGIPGTVKTKGGELKHILKRAVRGVIPDSIIDRPKQGFGVPIHEWFLGSFKESTRATLDRFIRETDLLDPRGLDRLFERGKHEKLWYLLNAALWYETYLGTGQQSTGQRAA